MVASREMSHPLRPSRIAALFLLAGTLLVAPGSTRAASEIIATRLSPLSVSAQYGAAVPVNVTPPGGTYLVPTRTGVEFRGGSGSSDTLYGSFRTAGGAREVAWSGSAAYLLAGGRGVVAVRLNVPAKPVARGSHRRPGGPKHLGF